jgi:hypothetical protein
MAIYNLAFPGGIGQYLIGWWCKAAGVTGIQHLHMILAITAGKIIVIVLVIEDFLGLFN